MTITAKVIAHSRVDVGTPDLITLQLRYPRFIHAEAKTHRLIRIDDAEYEFLQEISFMDDENLSRNASSSRAIPVERMIQDVIADPAMPVRWGANQPGMQDAGDHSAKVEGDLWMCRSTPSDERDEALSGKWLFEKIQVMRSPEQAWLYARDRAIDVARGFIKAGYHKQVVNRLLEPFGHISVVVTATEWDNFFALRCHPDADPTMRALAEAMRDAIQASEAKRDLYHLPYITDEDWEQLPEVMSVDECWDTFKLVSAARCARVSYLNHDGTNPSIDKDLALAQRLLDSKHMSPFEHQAQAWTEGVQKTHLNGNLRGWYQFRKMIEAQQQ